MSHRHGLPWAATSVPAALRQWCTALDQVAERFTTYGLAPAPPGAEVDGRRRHKQTELAAQIEVMTAETAAMRTARMFWVARDMVDVALGAAQTLPEWTPALACPAVSGLLCWAKPAGTVPFGPRSTVAADVSWDAVWWWLRPDGMLQLVPSSRLTTRPDLLEPFAVHSPLWAAHAIVVDPRTARTEEANGAEDAHPFVSVVGAAWLLMAQPAVTQTRPIGDGAPARTDAASAPDPGAATVTLVDVRRPQRGTGEPAAGGPERRYNRRWWVGGHWRQQPCGPNNSQRKPIYVAPYVKGPPDKPLTADRVNVWRH